MFHNATLIARLMRSLFCLTSVGVLCLAVPLSNVAVALPFSKDNVPPIPPQVAAMTLPNQLFRRWVHSHEEDSGDTLVYRPSGYSFPPARGRDGFELRSNGEFVRHQIGTTDRGQAVPGRWSAQNSSVIRVEFPNQSTSSFTLTILECTEQTLKVKRSGG